MEKCIPVSQKDKCPNGQVDAKCVPYTGPNLPNINTTSGQFLDVILSNINSAIGGGSPVSLRIIDLEMSTDQSFSFPDGVWLISTAVDPNSNLTGFKMGTTFGGNDIIFDQFVPSGGYSTFNNSKYNNGSTDFYFGGITSTTKIKLLVL